MGKFVIRAFYLMGKPSVSDCIRFGATKSRAVQQGKVKLFE